jgi:hypothetical protein
MLSQLDTDMPHLLQYFVFLCYVVYIAPTLSNSITSTNLDFAPIMPRYIFHLIANAHLDPVWLWDWREGMTEGLTTVRTILDLMDERPEMTFIRGEAAIYRHIEKRDPETFERIRRQVEAGRWDVVGGTHIQPDTNLPATETLARQFLSAQTYFRSRFGRVPRIAWAADSFGHSAGLPEILTQAGMTGFAFTRPEKRDLTLKNPAFCGRDRVDLASSPTGRPLVGTAVTATRFRAGSTLISRRPQASR